MDQENSINILSSLSGDISFYNTLGQLTFKAHLIAGINIFTSMQLSCETNIILYKAKMKSGKIETGKVVTLK